MAKLLGLRIRRYRALADVTLGKIEYNSKEDELPPLICLIGPNGSGKTTLLDAIGFLADCLREGVEAACDKPHRGGFRRLRTQGENGPIEFDLYYLQEQRSRPITYRLAIDEKEGIPVVSKETLLQRRAGPTAKRPYAFVDLAFGQGAAWAGESTPEKEGSERVKVHLADPGRLAIATLGQLKEHPRIQNLREYLESWYLSYFIPDLARTLPAAGAQKHLNRNGDNLANVVEHMERTSPKAFKRVLDNIAARIPGIRSIKSQRSPDGRLLLAFDEQGFTDPFFQGQMSDGTLKLFAYLLLLEDAEPRPFIGIEEPENGLYHKLLGTLATEFKAHASKLDTQLLITTHSPYLVDVFQPEEVWLIQRNQKGRSQVTRAADMENIRSLVAEGLPLGSLWYSDHLEERVRL